MSCGPPGWGHCMCWGGGGVMGALYLWVLFTGSVPPPMKPESCSCPVWSAVHNDLFLVCRQTVIHFCAAQNFVEFLQDLAELGASIDLADNKGEPLSPSSPVGVVRVFPCRLYSTAPGGRLGPHQRSDGSHQHGSRPQHLLAHRRHCPAPGLPERPRHLGGGYLALIVYIQLTQFNVYIPLPNHRWKPWCLKMQTARC